ncbi:hypothetical protein CYMTET_33106 [Cymbomonas tetramitiformis]|uniref:Uncharacterized protein n=1 Tax=Cymbomonas tetramitiformis TaxID=36881 RepID=A0AAE0FE49_9CHLO|nr:hypothetical protein CYMTET_33106 [Cymbomonas tetramitiformis]
MTVVGQVWSASLKFAASSHGNHSKGFSHVELVLGVEGYRRKLVVGVARLAEVSRLRDTAAVRPAGQPQRGSGGPVRLRE